MITNKYAQLNRRMQICFICSENYVFVSRTVYFCDVVHKWNYCIKRRHIIKFWSLIAFLLQNVI